MSEAEARLERHVAEMKQLLADALHAANEAHAEKLAVIDLVFAHGDLPTMLAVREYMRQREGQRWQVAGHA